MAEASTVLRQDRGCAAAANRSTRLTRRHAAWHVLLWLAALLACASAAPVPVPVLKPPRARKPPPPLLFTPVPKARPPPPQLIQINLITIQLQGTLLFVDGHNGAPPTWLLKQSNAGTSSAFDTFYALPGQPTGENGILLPPGSSLVGDCVLPSLDSLQCDSIALIDYRVPAGRIDGDFLHKTLVIVTTACGFGGPQTSNVEKAYMKFRGHAYQMETCSFNKTSYDRSAFRVVRTAIPCSEELKRCRWEGGGIQDVLTVAKQAITNGKQRLEGGDAAIPFNRYVILLPYGGHGCTWGGMGLTPGDTIWLPGRAFDRLGIVMQETLHNIGILHGYGPDWRCGGNDVYPHCEYGDASTSMGIGESCPSAPEMFRLGWASPIIELNSATFPEDNRYRKYVLPATFTSDRNMIRIRPNWLGSAYTKNLYLALRQKGGGDWNLPEKFNNKVNVHTSNVPEDNADSAKIDSSNTQPEIIAMLAKNTAWTYGAARVAVRTGDFVDANNIEVFVCRYRSSASDCTLP